MCARIPGYLCNLGIIVRSDDDVHVVQRGKVIGEVAIGGVEYFQVYAVGVCFAEVFDRQQCAAIEVGGEGGLARGFLGGGA